MGHRRYIPINHKYHSKKGPFNGKYEILIAPIMMYVRATQNSGVCIDAQTLMRSSEKDKNVVHQMTTYYGVIHYWTTIWCYIHCSNVIG